jgi:DNA-binding NarL/FixJ family response regulator
MARGLANKEIARRLGIRLNTVKNHVHNILDKLQVHHRRAAARYATAAGNLRGQAAVPS